jgi:hypothetical protein
MLNSTYIMGLATNLKLVFAAITPSKPIRPAT